MEAIHLGEFIMQPGEGLRINNILGVACLALESSAFAYCRSISVIALPIRLHFDLNTMRAIVSVRICLPMNFISLFPRLFILMQPF